VPSDWLDQGQGDLSVPEVPVGFMREVVLDYNSQSTAPSRTVYYHYFETNEETVRRTALLRAAVNPSDSHADDTVQGFLRSHPHLVSEGLQHANFVFDDAAAGSARASTIAAGAAQAAGRRRVPSTSSRGKAAVLDDASEDEAGVAKDDCVGHPSFPALKCSARACRRWHHVPADVLKEVRHAAPEQMHAHTRWWHDVLPNMC
jgi:hypothetical protein